MIKKLRKTVRKLFAEEKVDLVLGWKKGTLPLVASPAFITSEKDVDKLIFDETCRNNLTTYFTKDKRKLGKDHRKIAVITKGCDARSIVLYTVEKQIKRDKVIVIGVPCQGVFEKKKIETKARGREVLETETDADKVILKGRNFEEIVPKNDILCDSCLTCRYPDAPEHDIFIGEPRQELEVEDEYKIVEEFESKSAEERWDLISDEYSKCIRCYACRNVCPACYCNVCFVDQNNPQWIGKTPEVTDSIIFHLIRNLHIAGRCVDCGACVSACPVDIDLRKMSKKVEKEIKERFDYLTGLDSSEKPAMATHCENEKQDFILG